MVNITKYRRQKKAEKFAKLTVLEHKSQVEAYKAINPGSHTDTVYACASSYAKHPLVQEYIEKALMEVTDKDIGIVTKNIVNDAKRAKTEVIYNNKGDTKKIDNASLTIASREQLFKLSGHPSFTTKGVNINNFVGIDNSYIESLGASIDRLDKIAEKIAGISADAKLGKIEDGEIVP